MPTPKRYVLKIACDNQPGIVAAVSGCITQNGGDILEASQFDDTETGQFLMRVDFSLTDVDGFDRDLLPVIDRFAISHELIPAARVGRVLILVSRQDHCLHDLLYRWRSGGLSMDVAGIVSNHLDTAPLAEFYGVPFHHLPVTAETKADQETEIVKLVEAESVDLVVLARYMQILSGDLATRLHGRAINIHHSFLPSFKGARPYHQAHARGVKLIGATAHYVTPDLDEGPIIEQEIARVKHSHSADDLVRIGQDTESRVLARAVRWHLEHRVFLNGAKTVIFD